MAGDLFYYGDRFWLVIYFINGDAI